MRRARSIARLPSSIASRWRSFSISSWDRPLSAIASSRLSGSVSRTAIAWSRGRCCLGALARPPQDPREPAQVLADAVGLLPRLVDPAAARAAPPGHASARRTGSPRPRRPRARRRPRPPRAPPPSARAPGGGSARRRSPIARPTGACRRIAAVSPALAGVVGEASGIDAVGRLQRTEHGALERSRRRAGPISLSTARRARSWRKTTASSRTCRIPARAQASMAAGLAATVSASRPNPVAPGTTAAISVTARASAPSAPTRTATASRIVTGTGPDGAASTSVTKNGLPPYT